MCQLYLLSQIPVAQIIPNYVQMMNKIFAYQNLGHSEEMEHCLLGVDKNGMKHYDYDCYYLVAVPKSVSDSILENGGGLVKEF